MTRNVLSAVTIGAFLVCLTLAVTGCGAKAIEHRDAAPEQGVNWGFYYTDGTGTYTLDTTGRDDAEPAVLKAGVKLAVAESGKGVSAVVQEDGSVNANIPKSAILDGQEPQAGDVLVVATSEDGIVGGCTAISCGTVEDTGDEWKIEGVVADDTAAYEIAPEPDLMTTDVVELYENDSDDSTDENTED